ncbi:MAG: PDZ domain-containing protein [Wenzhouxiangella sp.]|nr:MAG: PDZ domain-containing protein [Wenzhouxiangella sp.]
MSRFLLFALQFVILGLAAAFVAVWIRPDLLPALRLPAEPPQQPATYADAVNRTAPAVVSVYTRTLVTEPLDLQSADPLFQALYRDRMVTRPRRGLGSGVILSPDGLILTTLHVISGVDDIVVALWDGRTAEAHLVGADPATDLAVLRIDLEDLPAADLTAGTRLRTGDVVLAIGNAFGLSHTVTMGIVSATGRGQLNLTALDDFIQTDAAINAGNSGGALINPRGDVVGINSASLSQSMGAQGIGFAIPAAMAHQIASQIIEYGAVRRAWLGADLTDIAISFNPHGNGQSGARITQIYRGGPAWQAGLRSGDILIAADARPVASARDLMLRIARMEPGHEMEVEILRGGQTFTTSIVLIQQPPLPS